MVRNKTFVLGGRVKLKENCDLRKSDVAWVGDEGTVVFVDEDGDPQVRWDQEPRKEPFVFRCQLVHLKAETVETVKSFMMGDRVRIKEGSLLAKYFASRADDDWVKWACELEGTITSIDGDGDPCIDWGFGEMPMSMPYVIYANQLEKVELENQEEDSESSSDCTSSLSSLPSFDAKGKPKGKPKAKAKGKAKASGTSGKGKSKGKDGAQARKDAGKAKTKTISKANGSSGTGAAAVLVSGLSLGKGKGTVRYPHPGAPKSESD